MLERADFARIGHLNLLILTLYRPSEADTPNFVMIVILSWSN